MRREFTAILLTAALACVAGAQVSASAQTSPPPTCTSLFGDLKNRIETDYVGYADGVAPDAQRLDEYRRRAARAQAEAQTSTMENCFFVMRGFVEWFRDPHLFLQENPDPSAREIASFLATAPRANIDLAQATAAANRPGHDIEGVWTSSRYDAVVLAHGSDGEYIAVVTVPHDEHWRAGDVAATFVRRGEVFDATLFRTADRVPVHYEGVLERDGQMLHMPPITWGRSSPSDLVSHAPFDPANPRAASFAVLDDKAALISLGTFSDARSVNALEATHGAEIRRHDLLIIDLRGNEGGSVLSSAALAPYILSATTRPRIGPRLFPMALSSPRMIDYFQSNADQLPAGDYRTLLTTLVAHLRSAPGRLSPLFPTPEAADAAWSAGTPPTLYPMPTHVAVIVDRHSVSAAEAFAIEARRSTKVTLFGENTGGSIDYENVVVFPMGSGRWGYALGMPTIAGSDEIRTKGFNRTGVPVDVSLAPGADWIAETERYYETAH